MNMTMKQKAKKKLTDELEESANHGDALGMRVAIPPLRKGRATVTIVGTAPLVIHAFWGKALEQLRQGQVEGSTAKKGKLREKKDFRRMYDEARHISFEGWDGIHAGAFRAAMISACKLCGYAMTRAKLSIFVEEDGWDKNTGSPLVKISKGKPHYVEHAVRINNGAPDLHARPMWDPGWEAQLRLWWDMDQFKSEDVMNLINRAGLQVGICEGRPDSKRSAGCGWGTFSAVEFNMQLTTTDRKAA